MKTLNDLADNVYVLNLNCELFKYEILARKLNKRNIKHERFIGTGPQDTSDSLIEQYEMYSEIINKYKHTDLAEKLITESSKNLHSDLGAYRSPGALGCLLSNIRMIEDAIANDYESIIILQDDVYFHNDFDQLLDIHYDIIRDSDVFYLGATECCSVMKRWNWCNPNWTWQKSKIEKQEYLKYRPTSETYGQFALYLHRNILSDLLDLLQLKMFADDQCLAILTSDKYKTRSWVAYPNLVIADLSFSGTFDHTYADNSTHYNNSLEWFEKYGWNVTNYDLEETYYQV